jgi:hypothetical protein
MAKKKAPPPKAKGKFVPFGKGKDDKAKTCPKCGKDYAKCSCK